MACCGAGAGLRANKACDELRSGAAASAARGAVRLQSFATGIFAAGFLEKIGLIFFASQRTHILVERM
jgi:hypothetical protein